MASLVLLVLARASVHKNQFGSPKLIFLGGGRGGGLGKQKPVWICKTDFLGEGGGLRGGWRGGGGLPAGQQQDDFTKISLDLQN